MKIYPIIILSGFALSSCGDRADLQESMLLRDNWVIQSSANVGQDGSIVSDATYSPDKWYTATVPSTILGTLVENKVFPDPYFGTNILSLPGFIEKRGGEIPDGSPFKDAWWYRTRFKLPDDITGRQTWIRFHSINYKANIWLNGSLVADTAEIKGAYRIFNLNITEFARAGDKNCLALEIFPPKGNDLTITWVDWNPTPPDRGTGIWYDVSVNTTGPVSIDNTFIRTKLNLPSTDTARLTIATEVNNASDKKVRGILKGEIENIKFSMRVVLTPGEKRSIVFDPDEFSQLEIPGPRLWWPHTVGPQNLYDLKMSFETGGGISDEEKVRFGIREVSSWMNDFDDKHTRVFQINGKNIVIRGGGYVEDMMLRPSDERIDTDIAYAKHMGLNTLRLEAPRGSDYLFDRCDEEGILLMVGWCCCSSWENWEEWTPDVFDVAKKSWQNQIVRLRNHPSVFDWLYGSDNHPTPDVEKMYIQVLEELDGTRPYQSSATQDPSTVSGNTGVWMGPYPKVYSYQSPAYWYVKKEFNTEAGPSGEQISPVETMRMMMPESDLWPISRSWEIRLHRNFFPEARKALFSRYGEPLGLEEYSIKSQVLQYEATRAMFEAFAGNKYQSSGIIYWMYNSAWPSLYWQLYDYFFAPNGAFYGTKKACENLHIQYSYNDGSVWIVNGHYRDFNGLQASAGLYDFNMKEIFSAEIQTGIEADESKKIILPDMPKVENSIYFLNLILKNETGDEISRNFYWLSPKDDEQADFKALNKLPEVNLECSVSSLTLENGKYSAVIQLENQSSSLAFAVNPKIIRQKSKALILPVFWEDNYFPMLPGEKRNVKVEFIAEDQSREKSVLAIDGWNITYEEKELTVH